MNVHATLRELRHDLKRVNRTIAKLEARLLLPPKSPRGRKSMPVREREEVSRRMTTYWANRRA